MLKWFFCIIGWHWIEGHEPSFTDVVSGKTVYHAKCHCGQEWLVDSALPLLGFRVNLSKEDVIPVENPES